MLTNQQQEKIIQQHQTSTLQQQAWITQHNASIQQQQATLQQQQALMQQQQNTIQQHQTINQQQQIINQQQEQTIKLLQSSFNTIPSIGTTYIRWGRKQCPNNNTELIYSGFAGGSHYTDPGAAAEYVYLPPDPNYVKKLVGENMVVNMVTLEEKRFLINDQDILIDRLNRVENIVAILNATVKQLSTENQQQGLTIQQQEKTIQQQQTSILEHQTSIQQQKTLTQQQQSLINQQQISIYQQQTSNQHQQTLIQQHEQTIKQLQGSFSSSQGYAGGGYYGVSGSASESVCLPPDPNYLKTRGTNSAQIYGGEFDNNFFSSYADGQDVPCALCRTTRATSVIMIPGKDRCYSGWKREYYGYLSSGGYQNAAASTYECIDINPEYVIGGAAQHYGKLFYDVVTVCGSLKCPPYINNYPLTCVVNLITTEDKRLLLNDPDVLINRLNRVENIVAVLNATVKQLSTENQQQALTNLNQEKIIQQQQTFIKQQNISMQQQQTLFQRQEHTIKQLQDSFRDFHSFAGGGYYDEAGSAAEYVCLPPDPNYVKTSGNDDGRMYGGEFNSNFFSSNAYDEDVPCALCRTNQATSVIMIPGKNTCYNGWKIEYYGYLASGHRGHPAASAYVCVDINPEYIMGGVSHQLGKLFYNVLTKCGSLKCPPYINNYPLTCVVCSK
ncbi:Hypothetical predicted protein [Mytilus galloprovincialis]|nr:Hypothetical predicted protein [Mytilus galloprovincialis]